MIAKPCVEEQVVGDKCIPAQTIDVCETLGWDTMHSRSCAGSEIRQRGLPIDHHLNLPSARTIHICPCYKRVWTGELGSGTEMRYWVGRVGPVCYRQLDKEQPAHHGLCNVIGPILEMHVSKRPATFYSTIQYGLLLMGKMLQAYVWLEFKCNSLISGSGHLVEITDTSHV